MTPDEAEAVAQQFLDRDFADWHLEVFGAQDMGLAYMCMPNANAMGPGPGPIAVPKDGSEPWMLGSWGEFDEQIVKKLGRDVAGQVARSYGTEPRPTRPRWFRRGR
jgi:hypothetical protein